MADFRKWLYAFAVVALLAGLTVPVSAQTTSFQTCIGGAVNPNVRAEGFTERAGDITITCSGGNPTIANGTVPAITINVSMNTIITSKITSTAFTPNFNEALLLIDEPGSVTLGSAGPPLIQPQSNDLLACGSAGAPFNTTTSGAGVCTIINDGALNAAGLGGIYNGAKGAACTPTTPPAAPCFDTAPGHPNVFQGRQVTGSNNQIIQFIGVPLDGGNHTLRITNLRGNAVFLSGGHITNQNFVVGLTFQTFVTFTSPNSVNAQLINVTNGAIRNGLDSVTGTPAGPYLQCIFTTQETVAGGSVVLNEGFPSAWKVRNWEQINDNGTYIGTPDYHYSGTSIFTTTDMVQNVPGAQYNTESGFMYPPSATVPATNPPSGISNSQGTPAGNEAFSDTTTTTLTSTETGLSTVGTVSNGTRFAVQFTNIPAGTTISVPPSVNLINVSGGGGLTTGVMLAVGGTDSDGSGAGGTVGVGGTLTNTANFTVFYEVVFEDPLAIEQATIPVTVVVAPFTGANPQVGTVAQAQAGFAPFYSNGAGSSAGNPLLLGHPLTATTGPIPRFVNNLLPTTPVTLFSFSRCACDLLFPWVVADSTFTTSIVVANTSLDPGPTLGFLAAPQAGTVQFWFFGTADITYNPSSFGSATGPATVIKTQTSTASVPAGSYLAFVISPSTGAMTQTAGNGLKPIEGNFAGYVIAQSQFQFCHGIADISASGFNQVYLGLVMDKANLYTGTFGNVAITLTDPQVLPRTNQVFSDNLEN